MATVHGLVLGDNPRDDWYGPGMILESDTDDKLVELITNLLSEMAGI